MIDSFASTATDGMLLTTLNDFKKSISDTWMSMYSNPARGFYNPYDYNIITSARQTQLEINSNELKINVKKRYIKFNFNL